MTASGYVHILKLPKMCPEMGRPLKPSCLAPTRPTGFKCSWMGYDSDVNKNGFVSLRHNGPQIGAWRGQDMGIYV